MSADDRLRVLELAGRGYSRRAIADRTGRSKSAVDRAIRADARAAAKRAEREANAGARELERQRAQNARARAYRARKRAAGQAAGLPVAAAEPAGQPPPAAVSASRLAGGFQVAARPGGQSEAEQADVLNRNQRPREATAAARTARLDSSQGMARLRILDAHGETIASSVFDPLDPADLARACRLSGLPIELLARAAHDRGVLDWLAAGLRPEDADALRL